jgi:hypothetical protein
MATEIQFESQMVGGRVPTGTSVERHYSPAEIGELWNLSTDCVRNIFESEPGVLVLGNSISRRGKRSYTTVRIPQSVLDRVHKRMTKV